jgi:hypothetical protein
VSQSFSILVLSCDKYSDIWPFFFKCFRENFPTGNWPVYLGSNTKRCHESGVVTLLSGNDPDWSSSYKQILKQIPEEKIFVILEDLFLSSKVESNQFNTLIDFMFKKNANYIRYWANPYHPDLPTDNPFIGESPKGSPYRASVCGFWDKNYLLELLLEGESPWNFEIMGSYRTSYSDGFYATNSPICDYKNLIEKGSWIPASVDWANRNGIVLPLEARPILKGGNQLISRLQMGIFKFMKNIPWKYRVKLMNNFRKLFISY